VEQLEQLLAARKAEDRKQEIINELRGRQHSETISEFLSEDELALQNIMKRKLSAPRESSLIKTFHGRSTQEYDTFLSRLETHFQMYREWYAYQPNKVLTASQHLADDRLAEWQAHAKNLDGEPTWKDFQDFCLRFVNDPQSIYRDAVLNYYQYNQRLNQSVREFATKIESIHRRLRTPYSDEHRKEHLYAKILEQVRSESLRYPEVTRTYEGYIAHLQMVESQIPERVRAIKNGTPRGDGKNNASLSTRVAHDKAPAHANSNPGPRGGGFRGKRNQDTTTYRGKEAENKNLKRKRDESSPSRKTDSQYTPTCYYCQKKGHYKANCPELVAGSNPKAKNA
jgi:cell division septum initiation protein DivIVA